MCSLCINKAGFKKKGLLQGYMISRDEALAVMGTCLLLVVLLLCPFLSVYATCKQPSDPLDQVTLMTQPGWYF